VRDVGLVEATRCCNTVTGAVACGRGCGRASVWSRACLLYGLEADGRTAGMSVETSQGGIWAARPLGPLQVRWVRRRPGGYAAWATKCERGVGCAEAVSVSG
jgi:hypothetical protein